MQLFCSLFLGLLILSVYPLHSASLPDNQAEIRQRLETISVADQEVLHDFFKSLLTNGDFAATLFGYKPSALLFYPVYTHIIASSAASKKTFLKMRHRFSAQFLLEYKGWKLWKKYQSVFSIKCYFLEHELLPDGAGYSVIFIHKEKMLSTLTENADYFPAEIREETLEGVVSTLRSTSSDDPSKIMHFEVGLLLGYDLKSCLDFQKRMQIEKTLQYFPYDISNIFQLPCEQIDLLLNGCPNDLFGMEEKFKKEFFFRSAWQRENPFFCSSAFGFCSFSAISNPEISELQNKIVDLYNSNNFLVEFLTLLCK